MSIFNDNEIMHNTDRASAIEWCKQHIVGFQSPDDQPIYHVNYFTTIHNDTGKIAFSTSQIASVFFMGDDNYIHCKDCLRTIILKNIDSKIPKYVNFFDNILVAILYNSPNSEQFLTNQFLIKDFINDSKHNVRFTIL